MIVGDMPFSHSALFVNEHGYSYYSGRLARESWVTIANLLDSPWKLGLFPPSYHASYSSYKDQGYAFAKTLASLASGLALALASKFPIIPKRVLWEWFSANLA